MANLASFSVESFKKALDQYALTPDDMDESSITLMKALKIYGIEKEQVARRNKINLTIRSYPKGGLMVKNDDSILYMNEAEYHSFRTTGKEPETMISQNEPESSTGKQIEGSDGKRKSEKKEMEENLMGIPVNDMKEFQNHINEASYHIDEKAVERHLAAFLSAVTIDDEGYGPKELKIKFFKELSNDVTMLVGSGTKVLDALIYVAVSENPEVMGMFEIEEVLEINSFTISNNISEAKRAIQAATVLVYIQGGLPSKPSDTEKQVPKFIKDNIYKNNIKDLGAIARQLSCAPVRKFPARIFLNVDINKLPVPVATRCKLGIAGNKAVRYAVFAGSCDKARVLDIPETARGPEVQKLTLENEKVKLALSIAEFLRGLVGNVPAQLRMHPLTSDRPVVKGLLLKLTRAIIESLSIQGRNQLYEKMVKYDNKAFLSDSNFAGEVSGDIRVWKIIANEEADFNDLNLASLKATYRITN